MIDKKQQEQLANTIEMAMRAIQVADDELEDSGGHDLEVVRNMVQRCQEHCRKILDLLPRARD